MKIFAKGIKFFNVRSNIVVRREWNPYAFNTTKRDTFGYLSKKIEFYLIERKTNRINSILPHILCLYCLYDIILI